MLDERTIDDPWFALAECIKDTRARQGLSRQQLADRVGVSRGTILNWESGRRVPVEKCALLAVGLDVPADDLLELHPEVPVVDRTLPRTPPDPGSFRLTVREVVMIGVGFLALIIGTGFLAWSAARTHCFEVGAGLGSAAPAFRDAYESAGTRAELGCATGEVRKWGAGVSQALGDGGLGEGIILSLDREHAVVISGGLFNDWRWTADGAAADVAGYPSRGPLSCDGTIVLPLEAGIGGPGAMVQSNGGYVWVYGSVWTAYLENGGPIGPLGRPISPQMASTTDLKTLFEGGTIRVEYGHAPEVLGTHGSPLDLDTCIPTSTAAAARPLD